MQSSKNVFKSTPELTEISEWLGKGVSWKRAQGNLLGWCTCSISSFGGIYMDAYNCQNSDKNCAFSSMLIIPW